MLLSHEVAQTGVLFVLVSMYFKQMVLDEEMSCWGYLFLGALERRALTSVKAKSRQEEWIIYQIIEVNGKNCH